MKKMLALLVVLFLSVSLSACGDDSSEVSSDDKTNQEESSADSEETSTEETEENTEKEETNNEIYFKDDEVKIEDLKIKIKDTKVIPVGEPGNEYGEKPVFAIWYETTNLTDKEIDPTSAWIVVFTAIQDNDPNAINELEVGSLPDENHLDSQMETIKKDGTVENSIAYELDDLETPVTLVANQGIIGDEIGRREYDIK